MAGLTVGESGGGIQTLTSGVFYVTKTGSQVIAASTDTLVTWDVITINADTVFASNVFTCPWTGVWQFAWNIGEQSDMSVPFQLKLKKNTSTTIATFDINITGYPFYMCVPVALVVTDTIGLYISDNTGGTIDAVTNSEHFFWGRHVA